MPTRGAPRAPRRPLIRAFPRLPVPTSMRSGSRSRNRPFGSRLEGMDVEISCRCPRRIPHHRRGRRHDQEPTAFSDPVHMPMPMHHDDAVGHPLQLSDEPAAIDECGSDPFRQGLGGFGILDRMMVERDDPGGIGVLADGRSRARTISSADTIPAHSWRKKCVSAFEFTVMIPSPSARPAVGPSGRGRARASQAPEAGAGGRNPRDLDRLDLGRSAPAEAESPGARDLQGCRGWSEEQLLSFASGGRGRRRAGSPSTAAAT